MQSGQLTSLIKHYKKQSTHDADGHTSTRFVLQQQFYAEIKSLSVQAYMDSQREGTELQCRLVYRPSDAPNIANFDMLQDADTGVYYQIVGVLPQIRAGEQSLLCATGKVQDMTFSDY